MEFISQMSKVASRFEENAITPSEVLVEAALVTCRSGPLLFLFLEVGAEVVGDPSQVSADRDC